MCYLTLSDRSFPKRLAFLYLEEIHAGFVEELERDYGGTWRDIVTTVARPYAFIKFGASGVDVLLRRCRYDMITTLSESVTTLKNQ